MDQFLQFTRNDGNILILNKDHIVAVMPNGNGTEIMISTGATYCVKDNFETLRTYITAEKAPF